MNTIKVFTVVYTAPASGAFRDLSTIARFRDRQSAEYFAAGKRHYDSPATIDEENVPVKISIRPVSGQQRGELRYERKINYSQDKNETT